MSAAGARPSRAAAPAEAARGGSAAAGGKEVPKVLVDPRTRRSYLRGRFLGKGGFARCYELAEAESREVFAGKVVPKALLVKPHQKEKMSMEIAIHRSLAHRHVVGFQSFFEDADFVYVVLELCRRRVRTGGARGRGWRGWGGRSGGGPPGADRVPQSLLELHKRRKALSEPEVRYYLRQTILGCQYLHSHRVIHRDLKLGNLFLSDDMEVKIGRCHDAPLRPCLRPAASASRPGAPCSRSHLPLPLSPRRLWPGHKGGVRWRAQEDPLWDSQLHCPRGAGQEGAQL